MVNISKYIQYPETNIIEVIHFKEKEPINFIKIPGGKMLDTQTGEERDYKPSSTKDQCLESARVSLLNASELIKYNFLKYDTVMSVDLTFRVKPISYNEFQACLRNYTRRIRRIDEGTKYVFVKEADSNGRFHVHSIIWSPELTKEIIRDKWKYGDQVCFQEITEKKDLIYKTSYMTNITGDSDTAKEKRENLMYFPANKHIFLASKNLKEPKFIKGEPDVEIKETILKTPEDKIIKFGVEFHTFEAA